jgi:WhiB family redox-sensing transcriptional regulator
MPVSLPVPVRGLGSPSASRPADWRASAACTGLSDRAVFARRRDAALPALRACAICPVRQRCLEAVAPHDSWFDGVSGGRLWRNGKEVAVPEELVLDSPQEQR